MNLLVVQNPLGLQDFLYKALHWQVRVKDTEHGEDVVVNKYPQQRSRIVLVPVVIHPDRTEDVSTEALTRR